MSPGGKSKMATCKATNHGDKQLKPRHAAPAENLLHGTKSGLEEERSIPARKQAAKPIGERLLTLREAAEVLRLNPRTVRAYIRRGEIEARIIGGRWRFRRADLDAFFESAASYWDFAGKT